MLKVNGKPLTGAALGTVAALVFMACAVVIGFALYGDENSTPLVVTVLGLISATIPSIIAAHKAGQAAHDIRNGVLVEKSKQGSIQAMEETGVTEVVEKSMRGETSLLAVEALAQLLRDRNASDIEKERRSDNER